MRNELLEVLRSLEELTAGQDVLPTTAESLYTVINKLVSEISDTEAGIKAIEQNADRHRTKVLISIAGTAALTAVLAILVGVWQYRAVMNPLKRLQHGVERLAAGDFADELKQTGDLEFVALANDFNRMADELQTLYRDLEDKVRLRSAQLAQSERLASVGFLAAGVAHEINNPLAIIAGEAELALGALPKDADEELRQVLTTTRDEAFRCKGITQKLLSLARPGSGKRENTDLQTLAHEVASLVKTLPQNEGREVMVQGQRAVVQTDPAQIKQVLLNLVINALEAVPDHAGVVRLRVSGDEGRPAIEVHDNGKGIEPEALAHVFEPFYTSKKSPSTPGLGLGLSISHAIIEDLGGTLTAMSSGPGQGSMGYDCLGSPTGEDALRQMREAPRGVAIVDLNLPGIDGMTLFEKLRRGWPAIQVIVLTGFGDLDTAKDAIRLDVVDYLTKPTHLGELEEALSRAWRRIDDAAGLDVVQLPEPTAQDLADDEDEEQDGGADDASPGVSPLPGESLEDLERRHILDTLAQHDGNRRDTAEALGISLRTLYYRLSQYQKDGYL
eukprot:g12239.t1